MAPAEYDTDLPCKETIFSSRHPFMQDELIFAPRLTISQAFGQLFEGKARTSPAGLSSSMALVNSNFAETPPQLGDKDSSCDLTPFDLFILIHCTCWRFCAVFIDQANTCGSSLHVYPFLHHDDITRSTFDGFESTGHGIQIQFDIPRSEDRAGTMAAAVASRSLTSHRRVFEICWHVPKFVSFLDDLPVDFEQRGGC
jgi:hypothetical protein